MVSSIQCFIFAWLFFISSLLICFQRIALFEKSIILLFSRSGASGAQSISLSVLCIVIDVLIVDAGQQAISTGCSSTQPLFPVMSLHPRALLKSSHLSPPNISLFPSCFISSCVTLIILFSYGFIYSTRNFILSSAPLKFAFVVLGLYLYS